MLEILAVQPFVWVKSPVVVTLVNVRLLVPLFVTVTDCELLDVPTTWLPKLRLGGDKLTPGAVPVPDSAKISWPLPLPTV